MTNSPELEGKARAKINLDLRVLDRRADGYHNISTLFARIALHDTIAVQSIPSGVELVVDGDAGGAEGPDNLVHRAAAALQTRVGRHDGVRIALTKRIPTGAGLGGGSADAATTLRLVNQLWGGPLSTAELMGVGGTLGADIPFLSADYVAAWGKGKGDELTPAALPGSATILLAMPPVHVGTAEAYKRLSEHRAGTVPPDIPPDAEVHFADWESLAVRCRNDFEAPVHRWHSELAALHQSLKSSGALLARMSGSGAAHFALFRDRVEARRAERELREAHPDVQFLESHFE